MIRRVGFVSVLVAALIISACGRQVTPNPPGIGPGGLGAGFMSVKFRVQSGFNFQANTYVIVFNTANASATANVTPVAEAVNTGYAGYSIAIAVGGQNGTVSAQAYDYYRPTGSNQQPVFYPINATPQQLIFQPNSNGLGTEFTVTFSRNIANFNITATAGPSTSPTTAASTSPSPSPSASATASSSPTVAPSGILVTNYWTYNFFTVQGSIQQFNSAASETVLDSLGQGGATDSTYQSNVLDVATPFDVTFYTIAGTHPSTQDAITGGEIANAP